MSPGISFSLVLTSARTYCLRRERTHLQWLWIKLKLKLKINKKLIEVKFSTHPDSWPSVGGIGNWLGVTSSSLSFILFAIDDLVYQTVKRNSKTWKTHFCASLGRQVQKRWCGRSGILLRKRIKQLLGFKLYKFRWLVKLNELLQTKYQVVWKLERY